MKVEKLELMRQALEVWGKDSQLDMVIEECAELIDAIQKLRRGRAEDTAVIEEAVDVSLCVEQLKLIFDKPEAWQKIEEDKLSRLWQELPLLE